MITEKQLKEWFDECMVSADETVLPITLLAERINKTIADEVLLEQRCCIADCEHVISGYDSKSAIDTLIRNVIASCIAKIMVRTERRKADVASKWLAVRQSSDNNTVAKKTLPVWPSGVTCSTCIHWSRPSDEPYGTCQLEIPDRNQWCETCADSLRHGLPASFAEFACNQWEEKP